MKGNNNHTVGEIIKKLMRNPKLSEKLDKLDALEIWNEIIGIQLCKYILDQKIHKGILYVKLKSAVVRNELSYNKSDLINQINQKLEKDLISDIVLK